MSEAGRERRVLVTGAAGMLGSQLLKTAPAGVHARGTDLVEGQPGAPTVEFAGIDLSDPAAVEKLFADAGPLAGVIHAAAYTAVDKAEEEEELARRVNARVPAVVAAACAAADIPLVLVSTDFVFDGTKTTPYTVDDAPAPAGVYGRTKLEGEELALAAWPQTRVVRTQWLYGPRGGHFPGTIQRLASERDQLKVVSDQVGSPTSTLELAPALWDVLEKGDAGIYHGACEGEASWFDFAKETLRLTGSTTHVDPCTTEEFPRPAPRPAYSVLDCSRLSALRGAPFKPWEEALQDFLNEDS